MRISIQSMLKVCGATHNNRAIQAIAVTTEEVADRKN